MECVGPVGKGITLAFPYSAQLSPMVKGKAISFAIPLREDLGWIKDPQNKIAVWETPSKCDMIQVIVILYDFVYCFITVLVLCRFCLD